MTRLFAYKMGWKVTIQMTQTDRLDTQHLEAKKFKELQSIFVQNVEYQLREPLTIIQGYAHLLSEGALGKLEQEQQQAIYAIANRADELRSFVERITTLLVAKAQVAALISLDLKDIVMEVIEARRSKAERSNTTLVVYSPPDLPLVKGQPYHLRQAVDCLIDNALKSTSNGGRVEIRLEAETNWICLTVTDTGIGIALEKLGCIFNTCSQNGDCPNQEQYGGIHLGLAVVKAVIEAYSGQVELKRQPGHGGQFMIKLPIPHRHSA